MRIYTKTGDLGETGLIGGGRVPKQALRMHAIGEVDELNSTVGLARLYAHGTEMDALLARIQSWLFDLGSELAAPPDGGVVYTAVTEAHVESLERSIDSMTAALPPLRNFILPGGTPLAAQLHLSRSVCRRAERTVHELNAAEGVSLETRMFLNRLSDWFFTAARTANALSNVEDVPWHRSDGL